MAFLCSEIHLKNIKRAQKRYYATRVFGTPEHENIESKHIDKYQNIFGTHQHEKRRIPPNIFPIILKRFGWKLQTVHALFVLCVTDDFIGNQ